MSPVAFLLSAFGICTVGVLLLLLRNRQPSGTIHGVRSFEREMRALDPKRNKVRNDPFGRFDDGVVDLRETRVASGITLVPPAASTPTVVVVPAPPTTEQPAAPTTEQLSPPTSETPPTDPGEADRPRDEARG